MKFKAGDVIQYTKTFVGNEPNSIVKNGFYGNLLLVLSVSFEPETSIGLETMMCAWNITRDKIWKIYGRELDYYSLLRSSDSG